MDADGQLLNGTHIGRFLAQTSIPQRVLNALRSRNKSDFVVNVITKSNRTKQASVISLMIGKEEGAILVVQDVEDKLELMRLLKQKENDLLRLVNNKSLIIVRTDMQSRIVFANKTFLILTGFMEEGVLGKSIESFLGKISSYEFKAIWEKIINQDLTQVEFLIKSNDKSHASWLAYIQLTADEVVLSGIDITELRKTRAMLEGHQKLLNDVFENMPGKVMVINRNFEVVFTNCTNIVEKSDKLPSCHETNMPTKS